MNADIAETIQNDGKAINRLLLARRIDASTAPRLTAVCAQTMILYGLRRSRAVPVKTIAQLLPDISTALSAVRRRRVQVRLSADGLALEVPHPQPAPLAPPQTWPTGGDLLIGRAYGLAGGRDVRIDLSDFPHILVVGQTGSGKSNLLQAAVLSQALGVSPADLRFVMVDCKREALLPFTALPHTNTFTWRADEAAAVLAWADAEIQRRIDDGGQQSPRLVIVIDELRTAIASRQASAALDRIVGVGRGLGVHVLAATQHVDFAGSIRANFTARIVGPVVSGQAAAQASGMPGSGAQYLQGAGSFVMVSGGVADRFQGFYMAGHVDRLVRQVVQRWGAVQAAPQVVPPVAPWAAKPQRDPRQELAEKIRPVWENGGSLAAMVRAAFGDNANTGGANRQRVLDAVKMLEGG